MPVKLYDFATHESLWYDCGGLKCTHNAKLQAFAPPTDFVKVRGNENLVEDLFSYLSNPRFETACRYCNGTFGTRKIPAAEQLKNSSLMR